MPVIIIINVFRLKFHLCLGRWFDALSFCSFTSTFLLHKYTNWTSSKSQNWRFFISVSSQFSFLRYMPTAKKQKKNNHFVNWVLFVSFGNGQKFEWAHERQTNKRIVIITTEITIETFLLLLQIHSFQICFLCKCHWICNFMVKLTDVYSRRMQIYLNILQ